MSGVGEITPPITKDKKIKYFRYFFNISDVIKLILASTTTTSGNSKTTPNGKMKEITNSIY